MSTSPTRHDIDLTANLAGSRVTFTGNGGASLPKASGAHRFNFTLTDNTGLNVQFASLDTEDSTTCPPNPGQNSGQIVGVTIGPRPGTASFTDNNNNHGTLNVCYQWNFTCDDPTKHPITYDPIIINGGV